MEVYEESLAAKGHKQSNHWLNGVNRVTLKLPRTVIVDSGQAKCNQGMMESLEQWVFAYQHNVIDVGMIDTVGGLDHCKVVGFDRFGYTAVHYSQRSAAQNLGTLAGTAVVGIVQAMVLTPCSVAPC